MIGVILRLFMKNETPKNICYLIIIAFFLPFMSISELFEGASKALLVMPHTVYFFPDDSGRGRIFISVFVVLWSEIEV